MVKIIKTLCHSNNVRFVNNDDYHLFWGLGKDGELYYHYKWISGSDGPEEWYSISELDFHLSLKEMCNIVKAFKPLMAFL